MRIVFAKMRKLVLRASRFQKVKLINLLTFYMFLISTCQSSNTCNEG